MSDLGAIVLMLATLSLVAVATNLILRRMHQRCDEIATGMVNDRPIPVGYRWLLLYCDYVGNAFGLVLLLAAVAGGFLSASEVAGNPNVRITAYFCAATSGWVSVGTLLLVPLWIFHLVGRIREAEAD